MSNSKKEVLKACRDLKLKSDSEQLIIKLLEVAVQTDLESMRGYRTNILYTLRAESLTDRNMQLLDHLEDLDLIRFREEDFIYQPLFIICDYGLDFWIGDYTRNLTSH